MMTLLKAQFRFRHLKDAHLLAHFLAKICPNPRIAMVGISELLVNAVEHGNLGISSKEKVALHKQNQWLEEIDRRTDLPENIDKTVGVELTRSDTEIMLKVSDQGEGFDWITYEELTPFEPSNPLSTQGRGILMAKKLTFKHLEYSEKGNVVTAIIDVPAHSHSEGDH